MTQFHIEVSTKKSACKLLTFESRCITYRSDSVVSVRISQVSNPSAMKTSTYSERPSLARISLTSLMERAAEDL